MRAQVAVLFWDAFKGKLSPVKKTESKALGCVSVGMDVIDSDPRAKALY